MSAFTYGTSNEALVHELGRGRPKTTTDLLDIATKFVDGEDAVGTIFRKGKAPCHTGESTSGVKKNQHDRRDKRRRDGRPRRTENEVAAADRPLRPPSKADTSHFQKLMDEPCQNHGLPCGTSFGTASS